MILTYNEIMALGFRIGTDIKQATVELAIEAAELYYLAPSLTDDQYNAILALDGDNALIAGGTYTDDDGGTHVVAGLKKALAYIAYAELLRMNINATTFGSVQKNDEFSTNVDPKEQIHYFLAVGLQYMRKVCDLLGYKMQSVTGVGRETYYPRRKEGAWL